MESKLWEDLQPANVEKIEFRFRYYIGCYEKYELNQFLRDYFQSQEEIVNKDINLCFSFSFDVNEKGEYVSDSLFIPHVQLIMKDILTKSTIQYATFTDRFNSAKQRLEETAQRLFINKVNIGSINELCVIFNNYFHSLNKCISNQDYSYVEIIVKKRDAEELKGNFNSFYIEDLQRILDEGLNGTLQQIVEGRALEVDIDENAQMIQQMLLPKNLPLGKWPSPVKHRLSLMQQVAVNYIVNENEKIISVNGPPGTGKTTLLKDVFAELIVKRALLMMDYDDPQNAFKSIGKLDINGYEYRMFKLDETISQYSMVVASSNNTAVENISKDLPKLNEIVRADGDEYDQIYKKEVETLELFRDISSEIVGGDNTWGLFSAALGKSSNITSVSKALNGVRRDKNIPSLMVEIQQELPENSWNTAVSEFKKLRDSIEMKKAELNEFSMLMLKVEILISEKDQIDNEVKKKKYRQEKIKIEIDAVNKQKILAKEQLENLPQPSIWGKFTRLFLKKMNSEEESLRKQINVLIEAQRRLEGENSYQSQELNRLNLELQKLSKRLNQVEENKIKYQEQKLVLPTKEFWEKEMYEERQKSVLWQTDELNFERGLLFLKALKIQKIFVMMNSKFIKSTLTMFSNRNSINLNIDENKKFVENMWNIMHLILPVISTTFASFASMYRGIGKDFIGYLFIDEAGQASPQQAAGALWRAKKAIAVGDPKQIEPVVTLDETILHDIRTAFGVSKEYIGATASVQGLADLANPIGAEINGSEDTEDKVRIGIPLWVHRRCLNPMFSIADEIAYNKKMVLANKKFGKGRWYSTKGNATQAQYVHEQGEFIVKCFRKHLGDNAGELPNLFIITPFTAVKDGLKDILKKNFSKEISNFDAWIDKSVGTVHTFQGKEARIVYFVTGTDKETDGAAEWSCQKPNLLNVAVTRAKEEFYVVGDLERFELKAYYEDIIRIFREQESLI